MANLGAILMVIPARGGSKRLPRKNALLLGGKPLISWTIETALNSDIDARILVSSDDDEILAIAQGYQLDGVISHRRPEELSTDTASTVDAVIDAVKAEQKQGYSPDTIVLLQPTSPLRSAVDIIAALELFQMGGGQDTVVSVCEVDHPTAWVGNIDNESYIEGVDLLGKRSQDYQKEYRLNGAIYVVRKDVTLTQRSLFTDRVQASVMPKERSLDIDTPLDFSICEFFLENR